MMIRVVMVHQYDPTVATHVSGIAGTINTLVKYTPEDIEFRLIGITSNADAHPVGRWHAATVGGRQIPFLPLLAAQPGRSRGLPLSAKLTWALMRVRGTVDLDDTVLTFHRIEPMLAVRDLHLPALLFLHAHSKDLENPMSEATWRRAPALYRLLERALIGQAERIFVVREDAAQDYRAQYPPLAARIEFLPTCVDEDVFDSWPEARRRTERRLLAEHYGLDSGRRWVLFVGRFEGQKDPLLLLEAMLHLDGLKNSAQLILIGRGTLEARIEAYIAAHKLAERVRVVGPQPHAELVRWLNAGDCFCLSSAFEGMPLALLEALQCGLPAVSTATGQTPRILREPAGVVVHERSAQALAGGLIQVLNRAPDRAACRQAAAPYTARKAVQQVFAAYREIHAAMVRNREARAETPACASHGARRSPPSPQVR